MKERLIFLGPPGAGKGTQAELLCKNFTFQHLSTGDLLRAEVKAGSSLGLKAADLMNKGELVGDELVLSIVEKRLSGEKNGWLLDGFPRNVLQAKALQDLLDKIQQPIQLVVLLELNDEILISRLLSRGRPDDTESVIRHRLEVYRNKTSPLVEHYSNLGLLKSVKAEGDINEIASRLEKILD